LHFRFARGDALAEPKHMLVRVPNMDFAKAPRFILRTPNYLRAQPGNPFK
jgi:hypothetical protein